MPRMVTETKPIKLKAVLYQANCNIADFQKMLQQDLNITTSKTSIRYLINNGIVFKKVDNFKNKIERLIDAKFGYVLDKINLSATDIWDKLEVAEENNFDELLNKFMEVIMLRSETLQHFGLKQNPFSLDINKESEIYLSSSHAYALEVLIEAAEYGGFAVITGQVGSGKSIIFSKFVEEVKENGKYHIMFPEAIDKTKLNAKQILQACVYDLTESAPKSNIEALSRQVKKLLTNRTSNNEKTVLIIEEAHDLPVQTLKFLKRIWEMKNGLTRLLGIILIGQNELEARLFGNSNTDIREVTARVTHARVEAITDEVEEYISHRVKSVKGDVNKIIEPAAIKEVGKKLSATDRFGKQVSFAYPLAINNLMTKLMNYCTETGESIITKDIVINII